MALPTNYVDDVLDASQNVERKYNIKDANGNIVYENISIDDVTRYLQQGSAYSAELVNQQNAKINSLEELVGEGGVTTITEATWNAMSDADKKAKNYCVIDADGKGKLYIKGVETSGESSALKVTLNTPEFKATNVQDGLIEATYKLIEESEWNTMSEAQKKSGRFAVKRQSSAKFSADTIAQSNTSLSSDNVQGALNNLNNSLNNISVYSIPSVNTGNEKGSDAYNYAVKNKKTVELQIDITVSVKSTTNVAYTLPNEYRPYRTVRKSTQLYGNSSPTNYIEINANGNVILYGDSASSSSKCRFIDSITYVTAN